MQRRETFFVLGVWGSRVGEKEGEKFKRVGLCGMGEGGAACCVFDVNFKAEAEEVGNCWYVAELDCAEEGRLIGGIGTGIGCGVEQ